MPTHLRRPSGRIAVALALSILSLSSVNSARAAVIDLTYDSLMDMVRPEVHPGIAVHHNLQVTISGGTQVTEQRDRNARQYRDQNAMAQILSSTGDEGSYASWQVAADGRLVRTQNDPQSTRTMTVTLLPGNVCRLDVMDQLKPGFTEYAFLRISTHTIGYFSSYRVTRTTCTMR